MAARYREDVPRSRLLARHHADRSAGAGNTPCAGQDRAGPRRRADQLSGIGRYRRSPRVRLPRGGNPRARPRRRPASEHSGIRLHLLRTGAYRRHSGHRAARTPAHRRLRISCAASGAVGYVIPDAIKGFDYRAMAQELAPKAPALRAVFVVGEPANGQHCPVDAARDNRGRGRAYRPCASTRPRSTTMLLSGGTTSLSKLIPRTHDDYVLNARLCGAAAGFDESTVLMAILPLGHNYNLASPGMLGAFYYGGTVVLAPSGDAADVFGLVERERVTTIAAVVPLISGVARIRRARPLRSVLAQSDPERRRALGTGASQSPARSLRLHAAGNLRHCRRPHQHDAPRRLRTTCCSKARARPCAPTTRSWSSTTTVAKSPTASPASF